MKKVFLLILGILLLSDFAFGDVSTNNNAQGLLKIFEDNADIWNAHIIPYAYSLFYYLVVADWVYTFSMMALRGTDFGEIMAGMIQKVFIIGFFMVMFNYTYWIDLIPKSFAQMANSMTSVNVHPDTVLEQGYKIVAKLWKGTSWFSSPGDSLGLVLAGIIILFGFIVMTAQLFMVKVKLYFLILGSYFMLALGGLGYTRTMGVSGLIAVFKAGLELFFITLILGFSLVVINQMAANVGTDNNSVMAMIGTAILIAYLTSMVGGLVESLTNGTLGGNGALSGSVKNALQGAAQGAVGGAMGAASGVAASKAMEQVSQAAGAASDPGMGGSSNGSTTSNGTEKKSNFINSAKSAAKTVAAATVGGAMGAASGAIKGMVGIGTHNAGAKSGSMAAKAVSRSNANNPNPGVGTSSKDQTGSTTSGSIYPGGSSQKENNENRTYLSGVPQND